MDTPETPVSREEFLGLTTPRCERVNLPMLGPDKFVWVQGVSAMVRDRFELSLVNRKGAKRENVRARLVVLCVVDKPGGTRMYTADDIERVGAIRVDVLQPIWEMAQKLSGFSDDDLDELGPGSATAAPG